MIIMIIEYNLKKSLTINFFYIINFNYNFNY